MGKPEWRCGEGFLFLNYGFFRIGVVITWVGFFLLDDDALDCLTRFLLDFMAVQTGNENVPCDREFTVFL